MTLLVMQVSIVVPNKYQRRNHCSRNERESVDGTGVGSTVVEQNRATRSCYCRSIGSALPYGSCVPDLQDLPPEHLFSDMLYYADDPPGHAGLPCCPEQVSKAQPLLAVQYRSMSEIKCRSMSGEGYRRWKNRAKRSCCCRSIGSALPYGSCVPNLQGLVRISVGIPCCFWYCWACT
ncbi:hypothetical protein F2Q69_00030293 [Brassica cretica]|uniref:Uncharacterized protein n=1 Tax=Brassica cretica TaxID=69181 RepID=A0A8S9RXS6_BRACR|nr:hypothetical protein F2Q69_00030293 [Brassica cretica]